MADSTEKSNSVYDVPKLVDATNYRMWRNGMQSHLFELQAWEVCSETAPPKPEPKSNLTRVEYLALEGKDSSDWRQYKIANESYKRWAEVNGKAMNKQSISGPACTVFNKMCEGRLVDNASVTEYLGKIVRQAAELKQLGWDLSDSVIAGFMLHGLPM